MNLISKFIIGFYTSFSKLSLEKLYSISNFLYWVFSVFKLFPFNKEVEKRMSLAFPDKDKQWQQQLRFKFYKQSAYFAAEFIKFISFGKDDIVQRMRYKNIELLKKLLEEKHYVVCCSGHFANYEFFTGLPLWIDNYTMCHFYDDSMRSFPFLNIWIKKLRSRFGAINIPVSSPLRDILSLRNKIESGESQYKGFVIGSLLDIEDNKPKGNYKCLLGRNCILHLGTEKIGKRIGAAFVYANIRSYNRGYYEVTLKELYPDETGSYMNAFISALEQNIREQPELWLMWTNL